MISFELNGKQVQLDIISDLTLLQLLRDKLGITSPKNGCAPAGQCGCCTVLIDGLPQFACRTVATQVAGKRVTTLEGLPDQARRLLAECFVRAGAVQCGYCTPGIAIRTHALLERNPSPSRAEIVAELVGHFCRCTGYKKIINAIELLARVRRGEALPSSGNGQSGVGAPLAKYGGRELVLGERKFIDDITVPGMVFAAMRFSDHPRALVKRIDTSVAEVMPGVLRVATWRDVPGERYVGLVEKDWPICIAEGEETRCVGD
ncbi:MAG TPA: 2Fe-2S iron-sulfur cluster-binding protein, partial [Phycisphaerae bacterium]|nr:2Fe-2S iron-sulfur cluster-binding protein [Phycisphaerae bacterium]